MIKIIFYFFISLPEPSMDAILEKCVSKELVTQAKLWDGSYLVKVEGDIPNVFNAYAPYPHAEMKVEKAIREQGRPQL